MEREETVIMWSYAILRALREGAFRRNKREYTVDNIAPWIAFSNALNTLILGDGYVTPIEIGIVTRHANELAKVLGSGKTKKEARLRKWQIRLLIPTPPTPIFEKTEKLYKTLIKYPVASLVILNGTRYLLSYNGSMFVIGKRKGAVLYEFAKQLGLAVRVDDKTLMLTYSQLKKLAKHNIPVYLLNEWEKEYIKEVLPWLLKLKLVKRILSEVSKMARIYAGLSQGHEYVRIVPHNKSALEKITSMLKVAGIKFSVERKNGRIKISEKRSIEIIRAAMPQLFSTTSPHNDSVSGFVYI